MSTHANPVENPPIVEQNLKHHVLPPDADNRPLLYVNQHAVTVMVQDEKGRNVNIIPFPHRARYRDGQAVIAVEGPHYRQFVSRAGPLFPFRPGQGSAQPVQDAPVRGRPDPKSMEPNKRLLDPGNEAYAAEAGLVSESVGATVPPLAAGAQGASAGDGVSPVMAVTSSVDPASLTKTDPAVAELVRVVDAQLPDAAPATRTQVVNYVLSVVRAKSGAPIPDELVPHTALINKLIGDGDDAGEDDDEDTQVSKASTTAKPKLRAGRLGKK